MTERRHHRERRLIGASWTLIWFGTILSVNRDESVSRIGALLWGAGFVIQTVVVARWATERLRRVAARV